MKTFIVLFVVFGVAWSDYIVDERKKQDVCNAECMKERPADDHPVYLQSCERGCRFFSLVQVSLGEKNAEKSADITGCSRACTDAYKNDKDAAVMDHCVTGCKYGLALHSGKEAQLQKELKFIQPSFNDMFSDLERLGLFENSPFSHMFRMMKAAAERMNQLAALSMSVVVSEEQRANAFEQPSVVIVRTSHSGVLPNGMEDIFEELQGSNTRFMDNDPFPRIKTATAVVQEVPKSSDWLECVSRKAGIPRWLLLTSIFLCSLMFVWLCFAATGPSHEHHRVCAVSQSPPAYSCKQPWSDIPYVCPTYEKTMLALTTEKSDDKPLLIEEEEAEALPAKIHLEKV